MLPGVRDHGRRRSRVGHGHVSRSPTRARRASCTAASSPCSSTRSSSTTTATSGSPGKTTSLDGAATGGRRRSSPSCSSRSSARSTDRGSRPTARLMRRRRRALRGADERGRRRPGPRCPTVSPRQGRRVTAPTIDAGDGLPLTVPALLRARVESPRRVRAARLRRRRPDLRRGRERRSAALARGLLARGRGQGHARRHPPPQRQRVRRRLARRGADRRGERSAQHVLDQRRAAASCFATPTSRCCSSASSYRSHDYVAALRDAIPELDLGRRSAAARRLAAGAAARRLRRARRARRSGVVHAMARGARAVDRARRPRGGGSGGQRRRPASSSCTPRARPASRRA